MIFPPGNAIKMWVERTQGVIWQPGQDTANRLDVLYLAQQVGFVGAEVE
jgi:hypothetical protein